MNKTINDPLLTVARIGTILAQIGLAIGQVMLGLVVTVTVIAALGLIPADVVAPEYAAIPGKVLAVAALGMLLIILALASMFDFFRRLREIIDSVAEGDPFVAQNAARLTRMAWLALAAQAAMLVAASLSVWVGTQVDREVFEIKIDVSLTGILVAIILFILARVFLKGAEMREDLEGTV